MTLILDASRAGAAVVPTASQRPSPATLTMVELRKMVDTRAGRWLLVVIALGCVGMAGVEWAVNDAAGLDFETFFFGSLFPVNILLPVLGILTVTSEWSQRTAQTTFTLVPVRGRVLVAKFAAGVVMAVASVAASVVIAAAANLVAIAAGGDGGWGIGAVALGNAVVAQLIGVIWGLAFGMMLLNTPLAIVAYFVLPTIWNVLGASVTGLATAAEWLDTSLTLLPLVSGDMLTGQQWAQVATSATVWVLVPLAVGVVRVLRAEVN